MITSKSTGDRVIDGTLYACLTILGLLCLIPFLHVVALSLSGRTPILSESVGLWPVQFNVNNYEVVYQDRRFLSSFGVSVMRVLIGVSLNVAVIVLTAYPLSRDRIHLPGRTVFKTILIFGMLFSGGLIPFFMSIRNLGLYNNFMVLILPTALNIFNVILVMNFFRGIPEELEDAATLDGASHLDILIRIFLPVSLPVLATVALFSAVGHWNSWFDGILFINRTEGWPLQSLLYSLVTTRTAEWNFGKAASDFLNATPKGLSAALIIVSSLPILIVYPLLQRYFVTGLTIGSVKG